MATIKEIIQLFAKEVIPVQVTLCTVVEVDKKECTIKAKPVNGNADMLEVRLRSIITDDKSGIIAYPEKDSHVLVGLIDNSVNSAFVVNMEKVESVKLVIDTNEMTLDKDKASVKWKQVEFNGGNNKGMVIIGKLVSKLNAIENLLKAFIAFFNTHTHAQNGVKPVADFTQTINNTTQADLENTKITH